MSTTWHFKIPCLPLKPQCSINGPPPLVHGVRLIMRFVNVKPSYCKTIKDHLAKKKNTIKDNETEPLKL